MPRSRLAPPALVALFALGAGGGLIGDAGHVASGTTRYVSHALPFLWKSQLWFPLLVGAATCALAEIRLLLAAPRAGDRALEATAAAAEAATAVASVIGLYALTALLRHSPLLPATALVCAGAVLIVRRFADGRAALVCGLLAALTGPATEIVIVAAGLAEYGKGVDGLFGVAPWLPALYFAFGVVAARLGELFAPRARAALSG